MLSTRSAALSCFVRQAPVRTASNSRFLVARRGLATRRVRSATLARSTTPKALAVTHQAHRTRYNGFASSTQPSHAKTAAAEQAKEEVEEAPIVEAAASRLGARFALTGEVMVSKLFPAGFGWQLSSCYAESALGLGASDLGFFVVTGMGDFVGVFTGHMAFYTAKKMTFDKSIDVGVQSHVALLLASAAFMSGGAWQPLVNAGQSMGMGFTSTALAVTAGCGTMFMTGLRLGRTGYSGFLQGVAPCDSDNFAADAQLSLAIGGATGAFVGTDVSYGDANWLRPLVGIEDGVGNIAGSITAGSSTALGFAVFQSVENVAVPAGKCWVD